MELQATTEVVSRHTFAVVGEFSVIVIYACLQLLPLLMTALFSALNSRGTSLGPEFPLTHSCVSYMHKKRKGRTVFANVRPRDAGRRFGLVRRLGLVGLTQELL